MVAPKPWLALGLVVATGCASPPTLSRREASGLEGDVVLTFGVSDRWSEASLVVRRGGEVVATRQFADSIKETKASVAAEELEALRRALTEHDCCALRSRREHGVPDEARPAIAIRWGELDCKIQMWDGEWDDDANAKACLDAVQSLHSRVLQAPAEPAG